MAWKKLADRIGTYEIPLLLAGPILRRVTDKSVTVWVALKSKADVTLSVYKGKEEDAPLLFKTDPAVETVKIGTYLHMLAITARAPEGEELVEKQIYTYDLKFWADNANYTLKAAASAQWGNPFALPGFERPSFALPPQDLKDLRIVHGSCRKPNGEGPDGLAHIAEILDATGSSAIDRPHQLFMTGDQIYADEVADAFLHMISDAGKTLLGWDETLPAITGHPAKTASEHLPALRTKLVKAMGFTTVDHRSHLLSFGEYLAMYLCVWSTALWQALPEYSELPAGSQKVLKKKKFDAQTKQVDNFLGDIGFVMRALANVPTYMVFDDHDVTDDWNMTPEWCRKVYGNDLGVRVVQNALAAFALCQMWGNTPEQFESQTHQAAGEKLLLAVGSETSYISKSDDIRKWLGVHTHAELVAKQGSSSRYALYHETANRHAGAEGKYNTACLDYHFNQTWSGHQIIATDTRSLRSFADPKTDFSPPDLLTPADITDQLSAPGLGGRQLIVICSTNFPPQPAFRQVARDAHTTPASDHIIPAYADAYDSWEIESTAFTHLVNVLTDKMPLAGSERRGAVVVLSGDVHTAGAMRITYWADKRYGDTAGQNRKAKVVFAQLVSSSFRNREKKTLGQHDDGFDYVESKAQWFVIQPINYVEHLVGWNPNEITAGEELVRMMLDNWFDNDYRAWTLTPRVCVHTLRDERIVDTSSDDAMIREFWYYRTLKPAHFGYRLEYEWSADGSHYAHEGSKAPVPRDKTGYRVASEAFRKKAKHQTTQRELVGHTNFSEIVFGDDVDSGTHWPFVRHRVRWREATYGEVHWSDFVVFLDPDDDRGKRAWRPIVKDKPDYE